VATYMVTKIRKELSSNGTHHHSKGVCTDDGGVPRGLVTDDTRGWPVKHVGVVYGRICLGLDIEATGDSSCREPWAETLRSAGGPVRADCSRKPSAFELFAPSPLLLGCAGLEAASPGLHSSLHSA
jgi:hypothetical protein